MRFCASRNLRRSQWPSNTARGMRLDDRFPEGFYRAPSSPNRAAFPPRRGLQIP
jgi:hypothetical protein